MGLDTGLRALRKHLAVPLDASDMSIMRGPTSLYAQGPSSQGQSKQTKAQSSAADVDGESADVEYLPCP